MSCSTQTLVQRGARVDQPVQFTDGIDGPAVAVTNLTIVNAIKSSGGSAPAGIDPASIGATITQLQNDTPADIDGLAAINFDTMQCVKGDVVTISYSGEGPGGGVASGVKSFRITDDPAQRIVTC